MLQRSQARTRTAADTEREGLAVMKDYGELARLTEALLAATKNMTPAEISKATAQMTTVMREFMQREEIMQRLGLYRTDPDTMNLVLAFQHMTDAELAAAGIMYRESLESGR